LIVSRQSTGCIDCIVFNRDWPFTLFNWLKKLLKQFMTREGIMKLISQVYSHISRYWSIGRLAGLAYFSFYNNRIVAAETAQPQNLKHKLPGLYRSLLNPVLKDPVQSIIGV
jgi:hypothetical protein